ncbi:hypothetical protein ACTFIY_003829 [Dictyostelium cf. discoideum]
MGPKKSNRQDEPNQPNPAGVKPPPGFQQQPQHQQQQPRGPPPGFHQQQQPQQGHPQQGQQQRGPPQQGHPQQGQQQRGGPQQGHPQQQQQQRGPPQQGQQQQQQQQRGPQQGQPKPPSGSWGKQPPQNLQPQQQQQPQQQTTTTTTTSSSSPAAAAQVPTISRKDLVKDDDIENVAMVPAKPRSIQSQPISVITNFFPVQVRQNRSLFLYRIDYDPPQVARDRRFKIMREFLAANSLVFTKYDGDSLLFSAKKIQINSQNVDGVQILIKLAKEFDHTDKSITQFFNVLTKSFMRSMGFSLMGRNYYTSVGKRDVPKHFLEVWKGFSTSVIPTEAGTMLLCDSTTKVVRSQTVLERIRYLNNNTNRCTAEIVNSIVLTRYNNKTYRISGISWQGNNSKVTDIMEGSTTFLQYYQKNYPKYKITDLNQPLLRSEIKMRGMKQTIYLIPELTYLTGLNDEMRKDFHIMKDLAEESNVEPYKRIENLSNFVNGFNTNPTISQELESWGISYQPALKVDGCVLQAPKNVPINNANALRNVKWVFIVEQQDFQRGECQKNLDLFLKESQLQPPTIHHPVLPKSFRDIKSTIYTDIMEQYVKKGVTFFLIIIPQNNAEVYKGIKMKSLIQFRVLTQCIFSRTFDKGRPVSVKLKQQVVAKLGLAPWGLGQDIYKGVPKKTMVIGIDVGHNSDMKGHSVVGFVATIDDKFQKFFSRAYAQERPGKEIIHSLEDATKEAMKSYFNHNNCLPELVIVYRDGVGDGMLDLVNKTEIAAMKKGFAETPSSWGTKPKLVYTIVKKNTNARFFTNDNQRANPPPGTLIDSKITHQNWYDFFLVSQVAFKGSINPTHYHVLLDEHQMAADLFQFFTFQMCHLYFNFEKSVRVPASCQFAHKMAFLIGRTVGRNVDKDLSDKLYFL